MSAATTTPDPVRSDDRRARLSLPAIWLAGVVVVPLLLSLVFNSWGPLTEDSAIRMAFATVAGQVVAVISALVVVGVALQRRGGVVQIVVLSLIAVAVMVGASAVLSSAGDLLLSRLDLVAQTAGLNG